MDPYNRYDLLLVAASCYKEAVEMVDRLIDEYAGAEGKDREVLDRALREAMKRKMECSAGLGALLEEGLNEDGGKDTADTATGLLPPINTMKLHEAISEVIRRAGHPLTYTEIANAINAGRLYSRKDGAPVPASQISARVKNYPHLFRICSDSGTSKIDTINQ